MAESAGGMPMLSHVLASMAKGLLLESNTVFEVEVDDKACM